MLKVCLKYADDLVIMSTSPVSLQKCIKNLEEYFASWKLEANFKKTKRMIFNKQGSMIKNYIFFYKNEILENAREYKYLGFTFSCSDKIDINNLLNQAKKLHLQYNTFWQNQNAKTSKRNNSSSNSNGNLFQVDNYTIVSYLN